MRKYIIQRFLQLIPILIGITFLSFAMMRVAGSDAVTEMYENRGTAVSQEIIDAKKAELGLDQPFLIQYVSWLNGFLHGDMGTSYVSGKKVFDEFVSKLPATLLLTVMSILATVVISIPLGVLAAVCQDKWVDLLLRFFSFIGNAMPNFFVAMLLMQLLSIKLNLLPVIASGVNIRSALMPMLTLAIYPTSYLTRLTRASILEVMNQDYLRTERAKGMSEFVVVFIHALKNSLIPVITYLGPLTASILTGGFVAESVFSVPGLGRYFVSSISSRDYTMIMGVTIFYSALIVFMNLICDILYKIVDPRIQLD